MLKFTEQKLYKAFSETKARVSVLENRVNMKDHQIVKAKYS